jgi:hypothetical protein
MSQIVLLIPFLILFLSSLTLTLTLTLTPNLNLTKPITLTLTLVGGGSIATISKEKLLEASLLSLETLGRQRHLGEGSFADSEYPQTGRPSSNSKPNSKPSSKPDSNDNVNVNPNPNYPHKVMDPTHLMHTVEGLEWDLSCNHYSNHQATLLLTLIYCHYSQKALDLTHPMRIFEGLSG